jgi:hypothetical protein
MIYRGQKYGDPVGEWWTTNIIEAEKFAMSRGGNRTWVVLSLDQDIDDWLAQFLYSDRSSDHPDRGDWYRIPVTRLAKQWTGVTIHHGAIWLPGNFAEKGIQP